METDVLFVKASMEKASHLSQRFISIFELMTMLNPSPQLIIELGYRKMKILPFISLLEIELLVREIEL